MGYLRGLGDEARVLEACDTLGEQHTEEEKIKLTGVQELLSLHSEVE